MAELRGGRPRPQLEPPTPVVEAGGPADGKAVRSQSAGHMGPRRAASADGGRITFSRSHGTCANRDHTVGHKRT